jgi:hypothetical protein
MQALLDILFHPLANAIMTVLTGVSAVYWLFTFLAGDVLGNLDLGVEFDTDLSVDAGDAPDIATSEPSLLQQALQFINVGKVPLMVIISVFKFIAWIGTLLSSVLLNTVSWGWKSALLLLPIFILTFFITRWATKPLVKVYHQMGYNGEETYDFLGRTAQLKSDLIADKLGAAMIKINTEFIKINVQSKLGKPIAYDRLVVIVDEIKDKNIYIVEEQIDLATIY